jgi:hypothetical protein
MSPVKQALATVLFFLPFVCSWVLVYRLAAYRRDGRGFFAMFFSIGFGVLRPDLYTDEGQHLLRWAWFVLVLTIPWCLGIGFLLFR